MMGDRKDVKLYREGVKQRYGQKKCSKTRVRFEGWIGEVHTLRKMCARISSGNFEANEQVKASRHQRQSHDVESVFPQK
jgi:hypothetical protein